MDEERLISLVQSNDILYNPYHKGYNNTVKKEHLWKTISNELRQPVTACKSKWYNLRDQYRRIVRHRHSYNEESTEKKRKIWKFEEEMSFLLPFLREKRTSILDLDNTAQIEEDENSTNSQTKSNVLYTTSEDLKKRLHNTPTSSDDLKTFKRIKQNELHDKRSTDEDLSSFLMKYFLEQNSNSIRTRHPIDNFFASLAETVKTFSPLYQNIAKSKLFNIVSELEREFLTKSSTERFQTEQEKITMTSETVGLPSTSSFQTEAHQ
ncbi:hypothetical protein ILUMI_25814 [Ignelater luminosus]|uniref:MADF domain-containing protein n=1 Tax=Ignelater luminosus TaxID=2038154 RepID=A0A8K0C7Q3_IGNLU|nr:hypothetical protein ILUMI_25814 [Ignelater luminosus]